MPICVKIKGKKRWVCLGDLRNRVDIQTRTIRPPTGDGVDLGETFTTARSVFALIETTRGQEMFDGTELRRAYSHIFYIKYIPNTVLTDGTRLTEQEWVKFEGRLFNIVDVEDVDERHEFLILRCAERGLSTDEVNLA